LDSLTTEDKQIWRAIRKELEEIGVTVAAFDANKEFILAWFREAVAGGAFEERPHQELPFDEKDGLLRDEEARIVAEEREKAPHHDPNHYHQHHHQRHPQQPSTVLPPLLVKKLSRSSSLPTLSSRIPISSFPSPPLTPTSPSPPHTPKWTNNVQVNILGEESYEDALPVLQIAEESSASVRPYKHPLRWKMFAVAVPSDW
jgi:hypothetical protein